MLKVVKNFPRLGGRHDRAATARRNKLQQPRVFLVVGEHVVLLRVRKALVGCVAFRNRAVGVFYLHGDFVHAGIGYHKLYLAETVSDRRIKFLNGGLRRARLLGYGYFKSFAFL